MPAVASGKVLVTGANGFVAAWVTKELLDNGFSVRGTVRAEDKATYLRELFKEHGEKFEIVVVEDFTQEGAFDAAVEGVDAVMHIASPMTSKIEDPNEVIVPAVKGTEGIIHSALKPGGSVKRIIVMSSTATIWTPPPAGKAHAGPLDEHNWNDYSVKEVTEKGKDAGGLDKYRASKVLAERAAWDAFKEVGPECDLVVLNAPFVFGPMMHECPTLERLHGTTKTWYDNVVGGEPQNGPSAKFGLSYVDVRDLARAHVVALTRPEAGGNRFVIGDIPFVYQHFINVARSLPDSDKIPAGDPSFNEEEVQYPVKYTAQKSRDMLGMQYRTIKETTKDTLDDFRSRGWL